ncbi:MAG: MFS transporter [Acidobacteriaceae bacterium]|nr:MFS transporter [Acidobacteriaceae bacterium]MBV9779573.1 MFS transporter [Acidobacteriaceae bacterium]
MDSKRRGVFYGWWVVLTAAVGLFFGPIPITVFSFGVFLKPLAQEFHSGRGAVSLAFTLHGTIVALGLPFAGRLIDRFGARKIILPSLSMAGLILLSAYFCSGKIWRLYLLYLALGIAGWGTGPVPFCHVISHWFDKHRGLALGLMMLGLGGAAFVMPSVAQYLIARLGWRLTFGAIGVAILIVTVPVNAIFLEERPEGKGLLPDGARVSVVAGKISDPGLSWRETWRTPTFRLLLCAFILVAASVQACLTHLAAVLADRGISAQAAALGASLFGCGVLLGRTGSGYLLDRFFAPHVAALIFGCAAAGIGLLRIAASPGLGLTAAFFTGLGMGAEVDIMAYLASRYFGLRSFGSIYSVMFAGYGLAGGLGTYLMGAAFDARGSYALMLGLFCVATLIGAALMLRLGPYRYEMRAAAETALDPAMLSTES